MRSLGFEELVRRGSTFLDGDPVVDLEGDRVPSSIAPHRDVVPPSVWYTRGSSDCRGVIASCGLMPTSVDGPRELRGVLPPPPPLPCNGDEGKDVAASVDAPRELRGLLPPPPPLLRNGDADDVVAALMSSKFRDNTGLVRELFDIAGRGVTHYKILYSPTLTLG